MTGDSNGPATPDENLSTMTRDLNALTQQLANQAPEELDLTNGRHLDLATQGADALLDAATSHDELVVLERQLFEAARAAPLLVHLAAKLACSKSLVTKLRDPARLSVIFAMYKEHNRIVEPETHPHGEDFLRRKATQLEWLFEASSHIVWRIFAVDDGCPEESGQVARQIIEQSGLEQHAEVLFLDEAIRRGEPVTRPLTQTSDSQKGGSIQLGMWQASQQGDSGHVVLFTDADLSTHLGQAGLLMHPILAEGADASIGSRREPTSVAIKKGKRNVRGKLFIYLWKRLLPDLDRLVDTQCGFKAFRADVARTIIVDSLEKRFAFDIELLLRTELARPGSIVKVPIAWIDSEAASTTTDIEPYLPMLQSVVGFYRHYLSANPESDSFAAFIERLDEESWHRLVDSIPAEIAEADPTQFGDQAPLSAADLQAILIP